MLVLMCTRLGDRRTRLGDRRQHLGYSLGMRAQQLLSRRGFAAANISRRAAVGPRLLSRRARPRLLSRQGRAAATISAGLGRGYYLGRAAPRLLLRYLGRAARRRGYYLGAGCGRVVARVRLPCIWACAAASYDIGYYLGMGSCDTACVSPCISARLYVQLVGSAGLCGSARLWQRHISAAARLSGSLARTRGVEEGKQSCDCAAGAARRVGRDRCSPRLGMSASPALVDHMHDSAVIDAAALRSDVHCLGKAQTGSARLHRACVQRRGAARKCWRGPTFG